MGDSKLEMPVLLIGLTCNTNPVKMPAGIWGALTVHFHRCAERQGKAGEEDKTVGGHCSHQGNVMLGRKMDQVAEESLEKVHTGFLSQ